MTKKIILSFGLLLTANFAFGQAKRYALLEHFTNTWCSTCAIQNPSLFSTISVETNRDLHHISYHWEVPYPNCIYFQANPAPQTERAAYYKVQGSPRVTLNGTTPTSTVYITPPIVEAAATTSPIYIKVSETIGFNRTATIKVKSVGAVPTGTHKLYAALVEKKTLYNSPNGETVHYNVFRKFITSSNGDNINLTTTEQAIFIDYSTDIGTLGELYVVAWVQNTATKEVLNSGTKFDGLTPTDESFINDKIIISPNPTNGKITLTYDKVTPQYLTVQNTSGQVLENLKCVKSTTYTLNLTAFPTGIYILKIKTEEGVAVKKIVKN
jgi:Secretion system C-terminal sorting domain/Outer membrane protein Omp28